MAPSLILTRHTGRDALRRVRRRARVHTRRTESTAPSTAVSETAVNGNIISHPFLPVVLQQPCRGIGDADAETAANLFAAFMVGDPSNSAKNLIMKQSFSE